jgi:hypothetical protein
MAATALGGEVWASRGEPLDRSDSSTALCRLSTSVNRRSGSGIRAGGRSHCIVDSDDHRQSFPRSLSWRCHRVAA